MSSGTSVTLPLTEIPVWVGKSVLQCAGFVISPNNILLGKRTRLLERDVKLVHARRVGRGGSVGIGV